MKQAMGTGTKAGAPRTGARARSGDPETLLRTVLETGLALVAGVTLFAGALVLGDEGASGVEDGARSDGATADRVWTVAPWDHP